VAPRLLRERGLGPWSLGVIALEGLGGYRHEARRRPRSRQALFRAPRARWSRAARDQGLLAPYGEWAENRGRLSDEGLERGAVPGAAERHVRCTTRACVRYEAA
jgi:hypothetical protein